MTDTSIRLNVAEERFSKSKTTGFALLRLGNILGGLLIAQVAFFATNSLAITAAAISIGIAIKTIIDAFTDLIMGAIVDRTRTRWGKARPYALSAILVWISLLAIYAVPTKWFEHLDVEQRNIGLVIYITIFSILTSAVFSTMANLAYEVHIKRSIVNTNNRVKTLTIIGAVYAIGSMVLQIALPAVIDYFNGTQQGFIMIAGITAVVGIATCIVAFMLCPEYTEEELASYGGYDVNQSKVRVSTKDFLLAVYANKYIFMWTGINFIYMLILMGSFLTGQYFFQFNFGNLSSFSIVMAMGAVVLPIMLFIPKLTRKYGTVNLIKTAVFISIIGIIIRMLMPDSIITQAIGYLLFSLPNLFIAAIGSQINFECMEYGRYKTGVIAEGMYSAFVSFAQKMSTSLSSIIIGFVLTKTGFDYLNRAVVDNGFSNWSELANLGNDGINQYVSGGIATVQRAFQGINFLYNLFPLILLIIIVVVLSFFNLEKDLRKMRVENGLNEDGSMIVEVNSSHNDLHE
ncbi:MAG: MFS transporter [Eubacteriales bacterium]|nr:MFS transporter [Eubacteriales bacterium]